jgi:hypothetical protein
MKIRMNTILRTGIFLLLFSLYLLAVFVTNYKIKFLDEIFSIAFFFSAYLITPSIYVNKISIVSPKNLMLLIFFVRLVICPITIIFFGYKMWLLPVIPTPEEIHHATIISDLAFFSFVIGWDLITSTIKKDGHVASGKFRFRNNAVIALVLLVFTALMIKFFYGSLANYLGTLFYEDYFRSLEGKSKIMIYANILFKYVMPFLGIIMGLYILEKSQSGPWTKALITFFIILLIIFLAYGPSRNNIVFPLLAFLSAIIPRYFKIKFRDFMVGCIVFIILAFFFQNYRKRSNEEIISSLNKGDKFIEFIQVYFVAPHIMTPMFNLTEKSEEIPFTLHSSFIESIPILGEKFRNRSGSYYYNIAYGRGVGRDQVFPTYGELVLNLGYPGLIIIFMLTGLIYRKIDNYFNAKTLDDPLYRAIIFYLTLVFNATIFLSYSVFGQFVFYNSVLILVVMIFRDKPVHASYI